MHDHEVRETPPKSPKTSVQRAAAPASDLLSLQRLVGNSAVTQHVQRAVQIDEMDTNVRAVDQAGQMAPGTESMIQDAVHDTAKAGGAPDGPSTLPPGGHATMEEEPG